MSPRNLRLTASGLATLALTGTAALAGGFRIHFSYRDEPRCYARVGAPRYVHYGWVPLTWYRPYVPMVLYEDCAPYRGNHSGAVIVSRPGLWRHYYAPARYRQHHKLSPRVYRAAHRSYSYHRTHGRHRYRDYYYRPHNRRSYVGDAHRWRAYTIGGGFHYRL